MSYLDKYPHCIGCPVTKYCGTMVSSIKLCHSYDETTNQIGDEIIISSSPQVINT